MLLCECGSGKEKKSCCLRYILGKATPATAEELMRSRYTAFVLKNKEYLLKTWYKKAKLSSSNLFDNDILWESLEIVESVKGQATDTDGIVEFKAHYTKNGVKVTLHERSEFKKAHDLWYYVKGEHLQS